MIRVGKPAPDFSAPAYYKGQFANVDLSEYKGKMVSALLLSRFYICLSYRSFSSC